MPKYDGITSKTKKSVKFRDGFKCVQCGSKEDLTIDHIIPRARGGLDLPENLQTLCSKCNRRKSSHITIPFWNRIIIALHIDEHLQNLRNAVLGEAGSRAHQIARDQIETYDKTIKGWIAQTNVSNNNSLLKRVQNELEAEKKARKELQTKLEELATHLKLEWYSEEGIRKIKNPPKIV